MNENEKAFKWHTLEDPSVMAGRLAWEVRRGAFASALKKHAEKHAVHSMSVWGAGCNEHNQIFGGPGEAIGWSSLIPRPIVGLSEDQKFVQVSTSRTHSLGVTGRRVHHRPWY
jgi:hypothetical protein